MTAQWQTAVTNFSYTGAVQTFTPTSTGYYKIELWGARGGNSSKSGAIGGNGAYTSGTILLTKNEELYVYVGGKGNDAPVTSRYGGWNGGGGSVTLDSSGNDQWNAQACTKASGTGGGATDVRLIKDSPALNTTYYAYISSNNSYNSRIMVAAGGGGGGNYYESYYGSGGGGGGLKGIDAPVASVYSGNPPKGGTQTSGGAHGYRALTASQYLVGKYGYGGSGGYCPWGGGGGGYYGGGSSDNYSGGGAGGSSYISGYTGAVAVTSESSSTPKSGCTDGTTNNACSIHYSGKKFISPQMIAGNASMPNTAGTGNETGHSDNGYAKITWLGDTI